MVLDFGNKRTLLRAVVFTAGMIAANQDAVLAGDFNALVASALVFLAAAIKSKSAAS